MIKKYLPKIIITSLIILLPIIVGLVIYDRLPEQVPIHFNANGEADNYGSRAMAVVFFPLIMLALHIFCIVITLADPKRRNVDGKPFELVLWITPVASIVVSGIIYLFALGMNINVTTVSFIVIGVLFIVMGNYMPKCGQNYSIGVRTRWALNDPENWKATHRFSGRLFIAAGFLTIITAFFNNIWITLAIPVICCVSTLLYSYIYYIRHKKETDNQ